MLNKSYEHAEEAPGIALGVVGSLQTVRVESCPKSQNQITRILNP